MTRHTDTYQWQPEASQFTPLPTDHWRVQIDGVGLGLFETMRAHDSTIWAVKDHLARLSASLVALGWSSASQIDVFTNELHRLVQITVDEHVEEYALRVRVTVSPLSSGRGHLLVRISLDTLTLNTEPATVWLSPYVRNAHSPLTGHKSISFGENVVALHAAQQLGCDEALLTNTFGHPVEGTMSNVFFVRHGVLITPPLETGCLPGVTRARTIAAAETLQIEVQERTVAVDDLVDVEEVFLTSTTRLQQPVHRVVSGIGPAQTTIWTGQHVDSVAAAIRTVFLQSE